MALLLGTGSGGLTRVRKRDYTDLGSPPQRRPSSSSSSSSSAAPLLVSSDRNHRTSKNQGRPRIEEDDRQLRFEEEEEVEEEEEEVAGEELDLRAVWRGARGTSAGATVASAWQKAADRADLRDPAVGSYRYVEEERDYKPLYAALVIASSSLSIRAAICGVRRSKCQGVTRGHVCVQASPESGQPSQCHRLSLRTALTPRVSGCGVRWCGACGACGACSLQGNRCRTRWSG